MHRGGHGAQKISIAHRSGAGAEGVEESLQGSPDQAAIGP